MSRADPDSPRVHYQKIVAALDKTILLMDEVDEMIPGAGQLIKIVIEM